MLTLSEGLDDQSEVKESQKDNVEFIEAREDAAETLESAEEPLDLVALASRDARVADDCCGAEPPGGGQSPEPVEGSGCPRRRGP